MGAGIKRTFHSTHAGSAKPTGKDEVGVVLRKLPLAFSNGNNDTYEPKWPDACQLQIPNPISVAFLEKLLDMVTAEKLGFHRELSTYSVRQHSMSLKGHFLTYWVVRGIIFHPLFCFVFHHYHGETEI